MTTRAPATLQTLADEWCALYPSAVFSGIVGDVHHAQRGGYHISIMDQVNPQNYSVTRPDDKAPPGRWARDCASALDVNLGPADMKLCHGRLVAVWRDRAFDPRAKYINAHNGWNGTGNAGRYDWYAGVTSTATDDHKWHIHLEIRRRYANDPLAAAGVLSILSGESAADYGEGLDMPTAKEIADAVWQAKPWGAEYTAAMALQRIYGSVLADDIDEAKVAQLVLAGMDYRAIADAVVAAVPAEQAQDLLDALAARLQA